MKKMFIKAVVGAFLMNVTAMRDEIRRLVERYSTIIEMQENGK